MKQYRITMPDDRGIKYESFRYPGGEVQVRLLGDLTEIQQAQELYVTAKIRNGEIMELACLTDALQAQGQSLVYKELYLPYLPYGRADRRFVQGDCFGLAMFINMLNTLDYNAIYTLDAHSEVSVYGGIRNYAAGPYINEALKDMRKYDNYITVILPDEGAHRYLSQGIKADHFVEAGKIRDTKTGKLSGFTCPKIPAGGALIVDDVCDGGGTFIGLAKQIYKQQEDVNLRLYVTHGIFSKGFLEIEKLFERFYIANPLNDAAKLGTFVTLIGGKDGL